MSKKQQLTKGDKMEFKPRLKIWQGSNRKNEFNPETNEARSYNHWVYACKIKGQWVFNDYRYSVTTSKHQGEMRHFLRTEMKVKNMIFVDQYESLSSGLFLDSIYKRMALAEVRAKNSSRPAFIKDQNGIITTCKKDIVILKKLGAKAQKTLVNHRINAKQSEMQRLERQRAKSKAARDARNEVVAEFKSQYESTAAIEV